MHKRKISAYLPRNELHSAINRKISAYSTFAGYSNNGANTTVISARILRKAAQNGTLN